MGLRDREVQAISSGLMERILQTGDDPFRALRLAAGEGGASWSFARFQGQDGKVKTGYVAVYFDGVAWVTAQSLAKHPSRWGNDDFTIPAESIVGATISMPRGSGAVPSLPQVQVLPPGQGTLQVETQAGTYVFSQLEAPFAANVVTELNDLLGGKPELATLGDTSPAQSNMVSAYLPGDEVNGHVLTNSGRWAPLNVLAPTPQPSSSASGIVVNAAMGVVWIGVVGWLVIGTILGFVISPFYSDPPLSTALGPSPG